MMLKPLNRARLRQVNAIRNSITATPCVELAPIDSSMKKQIGCVCVVQERRQYEQRTRRCDSGRFCSKTCAFLSISAAGATPAKSDNLVRVIPAGNILVVFSSSDPSSFPTQGRQDAETNE